VYQAATGPAVAVAEWVDGLKLGVGDRGLRNSRNVVEVNKLDEIIEQFLYVRLGRRDERRISRAYPATSDPVLLCTDRACIAFFRSAFQQRLMDIYDVVQAKRARLSTYGDRSFHCSNVA
jgi:hypothetical protein